MKKRFKFAAVAGASLLAMFLVSPASSAVDASPEIASDGIGATELFSNGPEGHDWQVEPSDPGPFAQVLEEYAAQGVPVSVEVDVHDGTILSVTPIDESPIQQLMSVTVGCGGTTWACLYPVVGGGVLQQTGFIGSGYYTGTWAGKSSYHQFISQGVVCWLGNVSLLCSSVQNPGSILNWTGGLATVKIVEIA